MAITIKTPQQIAQDFLDNLKNLKPNLNTDQTDSDWYIKSRVIGGVVAGVYADLNKISNDAFPQSARAEAVDQHLQVWTGTGLRSATFSSGDVSVTGTATGITIVAGTQFVHAPTQNYYNSTEEVTTTDYVTNIPVVSVVTGIDQNLTTGASLTIISPPLNITSTATVVTPGIASGTDAETAEEGAARVLQLIRSQRRGATESDYISWAFAADISIKDVKILRYPYGLGTVGLVLAGGTTDIDTAVDNDETIVFTVSSVVSTAVRDYVDAINPLTDTVFATSVIELSMNIVIDVKFVSGDQNTLVADTGKTQGELVAREIIRSLYKAPIGGLIVDNSGFGYIYFSDIEEQIDTKLHYIDGIDHQIVIYRRVTSLGGAAAPRVGLSLSQKAIPGTITINEV